jgi:hypothetical protein
MHLYAPNGHNKTPSHASVRRVPHLQKLVQHGCTNCIAVVLAVATAAAASVSGAPSAAADFAHNLEDAVVRARQRSACATLRPEPLADQTAAIATRSTDTYLDHNARVIPVSDPLPILKDLGLNAGKAKLLQGAGKTEDDAIKAILISGYSQLPDCSFTSYGISTLPNSGWFLTAVVLAGP